jgi:hypothetical protein
MLSNWLPKPMTDKSLLAPPHARYLVHRGNYFRFQPPIADKAQQVALAFKTFKW